MISLSQLNTFTLEQFTETFGEIFENSPHIAQKAALARPFVSLEQAFDTMKDIVSASSIEEKTTLILEHPELGKRIAMSNASVQEQAGSGLNALTPEEFKKMSSLNTQYMEKFKFPFIIAVTGLNKHDIMQAIERRLAFDYETEFTTALQEINKIAHIRFTALTAEQATV
ncbi:MAG: 2-oxo-4-hydroxy-4-carboxy-5-ureidoimidazoline decarboxylase [Solibacillus sp.]